MQVAAVKKPRILYGNSIEHGFDLPETLSIGIGGHVTPVTVGRYPKGDPVSRVLITEHVLRTRYFVPRAVSRALGVITYIA